MSIGSIASLDKRHSDHIFDRDYISAYLPVEIPTFNRELGDPRQAPAVTCRDTAEMPFKSEAPPLASTAPMALAASGPVLVTDKDSGSVPIE